MNWIAWLSESLYHLAVLGRIKTRKRQRAGGHFVIIGSSYNARFVNGMLRAAQSCLQAAGARSIKVVRVPGAFEIPVVAAQLARSHSVRLSGIICLGVILRGETTHAQHIGEAVSQALAQIQVETGIPIIHEVLLLETAEQAKVRCLSPEHNRGAEAAQTALQLDRVMRKLANNSLLH